MFSSSRKFRDDEADVAGGALLLLLGLIFLVAPVYAATEQSCTGGSSFGEFNLVVEPPKGGAALPVTSVNMVDKGDRLHYAPIHLPAAIKTKAKVAIVLVPESGAPAGHIQVLQVKPAKAAADWMVPFRVSVVGLVFGANGLDVKKVHALVEKDPTLIPQLADYADRTSKIEALVQTLSKYEQSTPGSSSLQSVLTGFSSQYGVKLPAIDPKAAPDQQATLLLHAVMPAFSSNDPLGAHTSWAAQSTGLAASVASLFLGSPVGLATGGAAFMETLRTSLFPRTDFRSAFAQPKVPGGMTLCSSNQKAAPHTRVAYLWMVRVPDAAAPSVSLTRTARIPIGWRSSIKASCASVAQLKLLERARDWELVSGKTAQAIPVKVSVEPTDDLLTLDLSHTKLPPGDYHLAAKWDWAALPVVGNVELRPFADFSKVKIAPESEDLFIAKSGRVNLQLRGADFEFLKAVGLVAESNAGASALNLSFARTPEVSLGEQDKLQVAVDTSTLAPGPYLLKLEQLNNAAQTVAVTVHPPNPKISNLPVRVNFGEPAQVIHLQGSGLERIERISSANAGWTLSLSSASAETKEREATVKLSGKAKQGDVIGAEIFVAGIHKPLEIPNVLEVVGRRPRILSARKSFAPETGVAFREGEIPADSAVSFSIQAENIDAHPVFQLSCSDDSGVVRKLSLTPGEKDTDASLDFAGQHTLFLSLDPGTVGTSGCSLMATISEASTGRSDAFSLGRITLLPRIEKFSLSEEKIGDAVYAGLLTGENLQFIDKTGWNAKSGRPVEAIPTPVPGEPHEQTLKIAMPWPPPSPHAPLYIWMRGEKNGRVTTAKY